MSKMSIVDKLTCVKNVNEVSEVSEITEVTEVSLKISLTHVKHVSLSKTSNVNS